MTAFRLGDRVVDLDAGTISGAEGTETLRPLEISLLRYLVQQQGRAVSRAELGAEVWGFSDGVRSRAVDTGIARLRAKIEPDPAHPRHLASVRGVGLRLDGWAPIRAEAPPLGRGPLVEALTAWLRERRPWLTVTGPPGVGKRRVVDAALASVAEPVQRVDASHPGSLPRRAPKDRSEPLVVVFGCDRCPDEIRAWSAEAPRRVLAVSRVPLRVPGEGIVEIPPLDEDAAVALFRERCASPPEAHARLAAIVDAMDRLPAAILLVAEAARRRGLAAIEEALDRPAALVPELREAFEATIARLPPATVAQLRKLAPHQAPFSVDDLVGLLQIEYRDALGLVEALGPHGLLRPTGDPERSWALLRIVRDLTLAPHDPEALAARARWLAVRDDPALIPDLAAAVEALAARDADLAGRCGLALVRARQRAHDPAGALADARRVRAFTAADPVRIALAVEMSALLDGADEPEAGLACAARALDGASPPERVRLGVWQSRHLWHGGRAEDARAALAAVEPSLPESGAAEIGWWLQRAVVSPDHHGEGALRRALELARVHGEADSERAALIGIALDVHAHAGELGDAARALARAEQVPAGPDDRSIGTIARGRGELALMTGDLDRASAHLELAAARLRRWPGEERLARAWLARVTLARGDALGAARQAEGVLAEARRADVRALGLLVLAGAARQPADARRALSAALPLAASAGLQAEILEALAALGGGDEASDLERACACDRSAVGRARRLGLRALLAARAGDIDQARSLASAGRAALDGLGLAEDAPARRWLEHAHRALAERS